ncbi:MAG: TRAP transporter small permease [Candidatus Neomarinimicrobiota bacterium]
MKGLKRIELVFTQLLEYILRLLFLGLIILVIVLVFLRYGFNTTIVGGNELIVILFIYTSAIGAAVIIGKKEHITITYFIEKMSPQINRFVHILNFLLVAILNAALIKYSFPWISKTGGYSTATLGIPQLYLQIIVPISCSIAIFYCLVQILLLLNPEKT